MLSQAATAAAQQQQQQQQQGNTQHTADARKWQRHKTEQEPRVLTLRCQRNELARIALQARGNLTDGV